jgi:GT2 family glycosyltransferase
MNNLPILPPVTICVLTYADYPHLARRCLESILHFCDHSLYRLVVGANAVGAETQSLLTSLHKSGAIDRLIVSPRNLFKNPMMRLMFEGVATEFIWWFDDDSYITDARALSARLQFARMAQARTVMWGQEMFCDCVEAFWDRDAVAFVRTASWYGGLTPPFCAPGGKGEFNHQGESKGNGRWNFLAGGSWFVRTAALRQIDWPDRRLKIHGEDVFLGEAIRQQGWSIQNIGASGTEINPEPRRWIPGVTDAGDAPEGLDIGDASILFAPGSISVTKQTTQTELNTKERAHEHNHS